MTLTEHVAVILSILYCSGAGRFYDINVPCTDTIVLIRKHLKSVQNFKESSQ
jgi:hypothetical protein